MLKKSTRRAADVDVAAAVCCGRVAASVVRGERDRYGGRRNGGRQHVAESLLIMYRPKSDKK